MGRPPNPDEPVPAAGKLATWIESTGTEKTALARALGVTTQLIYQWLDGRSRASHEHAAALERITKRAVRHSDWADPEAVERLAGAFRAL
jgi:DNA-binding transcriptional regulator YdaS (Cro superfamily)